MHFYIDMFRKLFSIGKNNRCFLLGHMRINNNTKGHHKTSFNHGKLESWYMFVHRMMLTKRRNIATIVLTYICVYIFIQTCNIMYCIKQCVNHLLVCIFIINISHFMNKLLCKICEVLRVTQLFTSTYKVCLTIYVAIYQYGLITITCVTRVHMNMS